MKKIYNQPKMEIAQVAPTNIVCYSGGFGDTPEEIGGQAPKRRVFF